MEALYRYKKQDFKLVYKNGKIIINKSIPGPGFSYTYSMAVEPYGERYRVPGYITYHTHLENAIKFCCQRLSTVKNDGTIEEPDYEFQKRDMKKFMEKHNG